MNREDLKRFVLVNLRCVTQSSKGGVPLQQLQSEYSELLGTKIPVEDLGYNSLESFLRDVPDVICLKRNKEGALIAQGVADASTAHIAGLVSKQKKTRKSKFKPSNPSVSAPKQSNFIKSSSVQNVKYAHTNLGNVSSNTHNRNHDQHSEGRQFFFDTRAPIYHSAAWPQKRVAKSSKQKSAGIVGGYVLDPTSPSTSTSHQLQGYINTKSKVPDYQDVPRHKKFAQLTPEQQRIKEFVTRNLKDVIQSYECEVSLNVLRKDYRSYIGTAIPFKYLGYHTLEDFLQGIPDVIILKKNIYGQLFAAATPDSAKGQIVTLKSQQHSSDTIESLESVDYSKPYSEDTGVVRASFQKNTELPSFFRSSQNGTGVKEEIKTEGTINASSIEVSNSLHDTEQLEEKESSACNSMEDQVGKDRLEIINDKLQKDSTFLLRYLKNIVQTFDHGIVVSSLQSAYKNVFGSNIPFSNFGFISVEELIRSFPNDLSLEKNKDGLLVLKSVAGIDEECIQNDPLHKTKDDESPLVNYSETAQTTMHSKSISTSNTVPGVPLSTTVTLPSSSSQQENKIINTYLSSFTNHLTDSMYDAEHQNNFEIFEKKETKSIERKDLNASTTLNNNLDIQILTNVLVQPQIRGHSSIYIISADKDEAPKSSISSSPANEDTMKLNQRENIITSSSKISQTLRNNQRSVPESQSWENNENISELEDGNDEHEGVHPLATERSTFKAVCLKPFKSTISDNITKANLGTLLHLHFLLFGVSGMDTLKKEILSFTNLPFCKDSEEWKQKENIVTQLPSQVLRQCLTVLCIHYEAEDDKNTLICKLMEFFGDHTKIPGAVEQKKVQRLVKKEKSEEKST